jgi:hypothetical protein
MEKHGQKPLLKQTILWIIPATYKIEGQTSTSELISLAPSEPIDYIAKGSKYYFKREQREIIDTDFVIISFQRSVAKEDYAR